MGNATIKNLELETLKTFDLPQTQEQDQLSQQSTHCFILKTTFRSSIYLWMQIVSLLVHHLAHNNEKPSCR